MAQQNKKMMEIGIVILGVLFLAGKFYVSMGKNVQPGPGIQAPLSFDLDEAKKAIMNAIDFKKGLEVLEKNLRDIFQKPPQVKSLEQSSIPGGANVSDNQKVPEGEQLTLEGIIFGGKRGDLAIISGKVVSVGDIVGGARVETIKQGRVILSKNGSIIELKR